MFVLKIVILFAFCSVKVSSDCRFIFGADFPENEPLILDESDTNSFAKIKDETFDGVYLKEGAVLELICGDDENGLEETTSSTLNAIKLQCQHSILKAVEGSIESNVKISQCNEPEGPAYSAAGDPCSDGNEVGSIYFIKNMIEICFNVEKSKTLYAHHQIMLTTDAETRTCFTGNENKTLYPSFDPDSAYKALPQTLERLLDKSTKEAILKKNKQIQRGHLAANADFPDNGLMTYHYINAVPQWSVLNNGIWKSVEYRSRQYAKNQNSLNVYTGTYGILEYSKIGDNNKVPIYLEPDKKLLPIPKFIWKIIQDVTDKRAIAFISYNDVYKSDISNSEWPCKNPFECKTYGWNIGTKTVGAVVKCCSVNELAFSRTLHSYDLIDDGELLQGDGIYTECDEPDSCGESNDDDSDNCSTTTPLI